MYIPRTRLVVSFKATLQLLPRNSAMGIAAQLNVSNIDHMLKQEPRDFEWIRFDSTNDCNLHCVYCHNGRSDELMTDEKLKQFLENCVDSVENFQFGCVMEPTLDKRMTEIMHLVANSKGKPSKQFMLQTNGVLLHMHDHEEMRKAGLTHLSVSIDSPNAETFKELRGGASFNKVARNMLTFREKFPEVVIQYITTVNTANIDEMEDLVDWGLSLNVTRFIIREMFFDPRSENVDHDKMRRLLLPEGEFVKMQENIKAKYADKAHFYFSEAERLVDYAADVRKVSYPKGNSPEVENLVQVKSIG